RRVAAMSSVATRGRYRLEFANQKHERDTHQDKPAQRGEAIQKCLEGSLAFKKSKGLGLRVNGGIRVREAVSGKIIGEIGEKLAVAQIGGDGVRYQHALMILGAAREKRGDEGDAKAASLIAEWIGERG